MSINIKKSHRGLFTAKKKATGKSTSELLHSKSAKTRSQANFARMAKRHWKKLEDGGYLLPSFDPGGTFPTAINPVNLKIPTLAPAIGLKIPNGLAPTNNPGGLLEGNGMDLGLVGNLALGLGNSIAGNFSNSIESQEQNLYSQAGEDLRMVDINQMGKLGAKQSRINNWWNLGLGSIGSNRRAKKEAELFNAGIKNNNLIKM